MTVKVRFVTCDDPISWGIRAAEMGFLYSHAEVIMPDGTIVGAHADGGVEARPAGYDAAYHPVEVVVEVPATVEQTDACHAFLQAQVGKPYDLGGIGRLAGGEVWPTVESILRECEAGHGAPWKAPDRWFCSELVEAALEHSGILRPCPLTVQKITPAYLFMRLSTIVDIALPSYAKRPQAGAMQARPV